MATSMEESLSRLREIQGVQDPHRVTKTLKTRMQLAKGFTHIDPLDALIDPEINGVL